MNTRLLKSLVTEAVVLDREINEKAARLKELKSRLVETAKQLENELLPAPGGGLRWTVEGNHGCVARVNFPSPSLKPRIDGEGSAIEKIKSLTGALFSRLFVPTISFKPVPKFREEAAALLSKGDARKLVQLCESASAPRVSFETVDRSASTVAAA